MEALGGKAPFCSGELGWDECFLLLYVNKMQRPMVYRCKNDGIIDQGVKALPFAGERRAYVRLFWMLNSRTCALSRIRHFRVECPCYFLVWRDSRQACASSICAESWSWSARRKVPTILVQFPSTRVQENWRTVTKGIIPWKLKLSWCLGVASFHGHVNWLRTFTSKSTVQNSKCSASRGLLLLHTHRIIPFSTTHLLSFLQDSMHPQKFKKFDSQVNKVWRGSFFLFT